MKTRNQTIDILRTIGLLLVIAAHASFNEQFFSFREFDVVLLVFCSGASFVLSSKNEKYIDYVVKRFKKLIIPIWVFLICFFPVHYLLGAPISFNYIFKTFLFTSGGLLFVWIFRVIFITSLCNPFIKKMTEKIPHILLITLVIILLNDGLLYLVRNYMSSSIVTIYEYIVAYTISYGVISLYGMKAFFLENKKKLLMACISLLVFIVLHKMNPSITLYDAKYPPTLYYISYGIFWSMLLSYVFNYVHLNEKVYGIIKWISVNSMTIYMWHIVFFYLMSDSVIKGIHSGMMMYLYLLIPSIVCTALSQKVIKIWRKK